MFPRILVQTSSRLYTIMFIISFQYALELWVYVFTTVSSLHWYVNKSCVLATIDWPEFVMTRMAYAHNADSQLSIE